MLGYPLSRPSHLSGSLISLAGTTRLSRSLITSSAPLVSIALSSLSPALLACSLVYSLISLAYVALLPALASFSLVCAVLPSPSSSPAPFYLPNGRSLPYPLPSPSLPSALTFPTLSLLSTIIDSGSDASISHPHLPVVGDPLQSAGAGDPL
ncbi:hypothetical protein ACLOJK_019022 [Asimina triloba]